VVSTESMMLFKTAFKAAYAVELGAIEVLKMSVMRHTSSFDVSADNVCTAWFRCSHV
jgi:hypothetical protein